MAPRRINMGQRIWSFHFLAMVKEGLLALSRMMALNMTLVICGMDFSPQPEHQFQRLAKRCSWSSTERAPTAQKLTRSSTKTTIWRIKHLNSCQSSFGNYTVVQLTNSLQTIDETRRFASISIDELLPIAISIGTRFSCDRHASR